MVIREIKSSESYGQYGESKYTEVDESLFK